MLTRHLFFEYYKQLMYLKIYQKCFSKIPKAFTSRPQVRMPKFNEITRERNDLEEVTDDVS